MVLYDPGLALRFPDYGIRIPVLDSRADRIVAALAAVPTLADKKWLRRGVSEHISRLDVERVHEPDFVDRLFGGGKSLEKELLKTYELVDPDGKPHRYEPESAVRPLTDLFGAILAQVAGTYEAGLLALEKGFCFFLGGGMHHARRDAGSGFCPLNDSLIAVARLRAEKRVRTVWIIDVDAHKGDGTAEIALDDPDTLTLSIHMAAGWPLDPVSLEAALHESNFRRTASMNATRHDDQNDKLSVPYRLAPLAPSDVDIPIARGEDALYLGKLAAGLARLEALSAGRLPDLAIVVDGADPYVHDGLESSADLALSLDQCVARDELVLAFLRERRIPSAWIMSGGYVEHAWEPPAAFLAKVLQGI